MSKSVSESSRDAAIGSRKKSVITARPGASSRTAAFASCGNRPGLSAEPTRAPVRRHPAALFEDLIDVGIELRERLRDRLPPSDGRLQRIPQLLGDLLPLRDAGHRTDVLELLPECPDLEVGRQGRIVP